MTGGPWQEWAAREAELVRTRHQWRTPRDVDARGPAGVLDGRDVVSFASNDYLGLSAHPAVAAAAHAAIDRWGTGSGAARLIVGSRPVHHELEDALAAWKHSERAVLFGSGYTANLGVLTTFAGPDVLVCSDELNHASIVDGRQLARAPLAVFRHRDIAHLDDLLRQSQAARAMVVSETVFSMDGDVAPVDELIEVCAHHDALLVLDEAHAVLGPEPGPLGDAVLRIGTCSKALGALGGFVAGPRPLTDLVENQARPYIFTTALSPADAAAALAALRVVRSPEGADLRTRLRRHVDALRPGHPSPILPIVCGDEEAAVAAASGLLEQGLLVGAIRPPTVPAGTSRLRVTVSAAHSDDQVARLAGALRARFP